MNKNNKGQKIVTRDTYDFRETGENIFWCHFKLNWTDPLKWADSSCGFKRAWHICALTAGSRNVCLSAFWEFVWKRVQHVQCYEYKMWYYFRLFHFTELRGLNPPEGFELGNVFLFPETRLPLKGGISANACIGPVGAEFWWGWGGGEHNLLNFIVFPFLHYFNETHASRGPAQRLNVVNVILSALPWASHRC